MSVEKQLIDNKQICQNRHLLIVRTGGSILNIDTYNCQELGLAKALTRKGYNVSLIFAGLKEEHRIVDVENKQVDVYHVTYKSLTQALASFNNIIPLLEKLNPTHIQIHEFGMWMSYIVTKWARKRNIPVYLIQGSYRTTQKPIFKQFEILFNKIFGKYILKNVVGIGCKSRMAGDYVSMYCRRNVLYTPIGLDTERFNDTIQIDWRLKLHLENKRVLLYVGILEQRRNPLFLIDLLKQLPSNYILLIAGNGPLEGVVKDTIVTNNLQEQCVLLGKLRQEELPSLYQAADLFLLASDYEIYGMVILEALFFGIPVITTLTAGSDILIEKGKNGYILPKENNAWVNQILDIMEDSERLHAFKSFASAQIKEKYIWDKAVENFINLYSSNCQ